jgi:hypothetical protein
MGPGLLESVYDVSLKYRLIFQQRCQVNSTVQSLICQKNIKSIILLKNR